MLQEQGTGNRDINAAENKRFLKELEIKNLLQPAVFSKGFIMPNRQPIRRHKPSYEIDSIFTIYHFSDTTYLDNSDH